MKTKAMYEIREFKNSTDYSRAMSAKLRNRQAATRLVKRLKKLGHDAFAAKLVIAA